MAEAMTTLGGGEAPEEEPEEQQSEEPPKEGGGFMDHARDAYKKARDAGKKKAGKKVAKKAGAGLAKKGAQAAATKAAGTAAGAALGSVVPVAGNIVGAALGTLAGFLADKEKRKWLWGGVLVFLILIGLIFGGIFTCTGLTFVAGQTGGTAKITTDLSSPEHQQTIKNIENYTKKNGDCGKRLEFADPKDLELIKQGQVDYRVLVAIEMLAKNNDHIRISHVMHLMSVVPTNTIETHSDIDNEYVDNISAHKDGMAFDVVEINCVYEKCVCNQECGCNQIPIKVAWQDRGDLPGVARDAGLDQVTELLGLPDGALNGNSPAEVFESTGLSELERIFHMAEGVFENIDTLPGFVRAYGQAEIEKALRLPPGTLDDQDSLADYASETGRRKMEQALKLPYGSLSGSRPTTLERNVGQESIEQELNIPKDWLTTKRAEALEYLENLDLSAQEKQSIETKLGWPAGTINSLITDLKQGDSAGINATLLNVGKDILEQAIGLTGGELDSPGSPPFTPEQGIEKDGYYGLPSGTFTAFVSCLKNGDSVNQSLITVGASELDDSMSLPIGSVAAVISGKKTAAQVLNEADDYGSYSNAYIASKLDISQSEARQIKEAILTGQPLSPTATRIGTNKIEGYFEMEPGSLGGLINGTVSYEDFIKMNGDNIWRKADALGIPREAINQLFAGDIGMAAQIYGSSVLADTFSFDVDQFISWVESGNIEALIENEVIQTIAQVLEIDPTIIGGILTGNVSPEAIISIGFSILFGGPLGGIFGGVFGGLFGTSCNTACYQPSARRVIHKAIGQLLGLGRQDPDLKPTQIITYREADVDAYEDVVDELYGDNRPINFGLFARDEMRGHIHVGY